MYVFVCMCVYCVYVRIYYISVCMHECICMYVLCMQYMYVRMYYISVCMYVCVYVCVYVCTYVSVYCVNVRIYYITVCMYLYVLCRVQQLHSHHPSMYAKPEVASAFLGS
jgi:hypothetical protein